MRQNKLIAVIALLIVVGLVVWYGKKPSEPQPTNGMPVAEDRKQNTPEKSATNFDTILPSDWKFTAQAEKDIQSLGAGQKVTGVLQDPTDVNFYFVTTETAQGCTTPNLRSIYHYNSTNFNFERLFRQTFVGDKPVKHPFIEGEELSTFYLEGYDNGKLIFYLTRCDDSPGPCAEPLLASTKRLGSLSVSDPYSGFKPYTPALEIKESVKDRQEQCEAELGI